MNKEILGNRYEIIKKIGEGGMARVYKAKDNLLNRYVAIKVLKTELNNDLDFVNKFDKEAKAAASLSHPNIVNVYDVGEDDEIKYIVMELLEGTTLKDIILSDPEFLENNEIIDIAYQIASALEHAHENNIIHRDIKPENIIIDNNNSVKVADFGIARAVTTSTIVNTKRVLGSVHYSSPEQARGGVVDKRTDIYSLGILIYELATKRLPFDGDSEISIALQHIKGQVLNPSEINKNLSPGVEKIILKSIRKNPEERYSSASELLNDLDKAMRRLDDEIVLDEMNVENGETKYLPEIEDGDFMSKRLKKKPKNKNEHNKPSIFSIMVIVLVALIVTLGVFTVMSLDDIAKRMDNEIVTVPDVVGMDAVAGSQILADAGFKVDATARKISSTVDEGHIISQSHGAGETLKKDYTISIVISQGSERITVPNVIHDDFTSARVQLENSSLIVGDIEYKFSDLPKDTVMNQSPLAGQEVSKNTRIELVVSKGPEESLVLIPSLKELTLAEAKERLEPINIKIGNVSYVENLDYESGQIVEQSIPSGEEISEESIIDLVIAENPEEPVEPEETVFEKVFIIPLNFPEEKQVVKIEKIVDGNSEIVYENEHLKSEGTVRVIVEGNGPAVIKFYYGDQMISQQNVVFE